MKIALVVFRFGPSHGSLLQTFALKKELEKNGHTVTVINRINPITFKSFVISLRRIGLLLLHGKLSILDVYFRDYSPIVMKRLTPFVEKELRNIITFSSNRKLKEIGNGEYDAYIVGSDQTWRPKYVYNIYNFFLDFVPQNRHVKRIAYAPSFGTSEWEYSPEEEANCKTMIINFDGVSVREDDGVKLCKEHFGIDAIHVADPTMLLERKDYMRFVVCDCEKKYVGYNFLDITEIKMKVAGIVSKTLQLPSISLLSSEKKERGGKAVMVSIEEWLSGIYNSEFVLVDSFHATVFCILFHKQFVVLGNIQRGLSRFTSLLKSVGLEDRMITTDYSNVADLMNKPINWQDVDSKLNDFRKSSKDFLRNSLK